MGPKLSKSRCKAECCVIIFLEYYISAGKKRGGDRIGRREKWPKKSWEEGEIGGKSRAEGENVR